MADDDYTVDKKPFPARQNPNGYIPHFFPGADSDCDPNVTEEDMQRALARSLRNEAEQLKQALPDFIAQEHSTGESPLADVLSLEAAYKQQLQRE
ncbi:hypothetical protein KA107_01110 [Candidatus Pacearchaeota archaeon]|nr:hypothetical protein [Candidatus Pacearchaeota archaeon]